MTQEFKPGDRVRKSTVEHGLTESDVIDYGEREAPKGATGVVVDKPVASKGAHPVKWDHSGTVSVINKRHLEPEWVVGQQVSGDDYERLPVGAKAAVGGLGRGITKVGEHEWHDAMGGPMRNVADYQRTLTHLPAATQPEDETDAYVEPEPLKEGDWVLAWMKYERTDNLHIVRAKTAEPSGVGVEVYVHPDAIVRPAEGQTPPWVEEHEEVPVIVTVAGTRVFSEESGAPMVRIETGHGSYVQVPVANITSITEGGAAS